MKQKAFGGIVVVVLFCSLFGSGALTASAESPTTNATLIAQLQVLLQNLLTELAALTGQKHDVTSVSTNPKPPTPLPCGDLSSGSPIDQNSCPAVLRQKFSTASLVGCTHTAVSFNSKPADQYTVIERVQCSDDSKRSSDRSTASFLVQNGAIAETLTPAATRLSFDEGIAINKIVGFDLMFSGGRHYYLLDSTAQPLSYELFSSAYYLHQETGTAPCLSYVFQKPLAGHITRCPNKPLDIAISYSEGVLPWPQAEALARASLKTFNSEIHFVKDELQSQPHFISTTNSWQVVLRTYEDAGRENNYIVTIGSNRTVEIKKAP